MANGNGARAEIFRHLYIGDCEALEMQHDSNPLTYYGILLKEGRSREEAGGIVTIYQDKIYPGLRTAVKRPRRLLSESNVL